MATAKTTYLASDGKEFKTAEEADRHDLGLKYAPELDKYVATLDLRAESERGLTLSRNRVKRTLLSFLIWRDTGVTTQEPDDDSDTTQG